MDNKSLSELIELAKGIQMTDAERNAQRNSFVYGNTKIENQQVTDRTRRTDLKTSTD